MEEHQHISCAFHFSCHTPVLHGLECLVKYRLREFQERMATWTCRRQTLDILIDSKVLSRHILVNTIYL